MNPKIRHAFGQVAEDIVALNYETHGARVLARRWCGTHGEIDLVVQAGNCFVFIEVKAARSIDVALSRVHPKQAQRIMETSQEYFTQQNLDADQEMRFDLAAVDRQGQVMIAEGALNPF